MKITWTTLVLAFLMAGPGDASAATLSKPQIRCALGLHAAGARVARAELGRFLACVDAVAAGKLPAGQTPASCLEADPRGRIAAALAKTTEVAAKRCQEPPPFGFQAADAVNDAFARILRVGDVFGAGLEAVVQKAADKSGARCQRAVARAMASLARTQLKVVGAELVHAFSRKGDVTQDDLRACFVADPAGKLAQAERQAENRAAKACRGTTSAALFTGGCGGATIGEVLTCAGGEARCGACRALDDAGELGASCRTVGSTVKGTICGGTSFPASVARTWDEETLAAIRIDSPRPPVHARNLFHLSVAMWDAWAAYDTAGQYQHHERRTSLDAARDRATTISFAAYRLLATAKRSPHAAVDAQHLDDRMIGARLRSRLHVHHGRRHGRGARQPHRRDGDRRGPHRRLERGRQLRRPHLHAGQRAAGRQAAGHRRWSDPNRWQPLALDVHDRPERHPAPGQGPGLRRPAVAGASRRSRLHPRRPLPRYLDPGPPPRSTGSAGRATSSSRSGSSTCWSWSHS